MYVRGPGVVGGSTSGKLVLNNDLAPTFARIAGLAPPSYVDGRSLLPVWGRNGAAWRTAILNERPIQEANPIPAYRAAITRRYTYVEYDTSEKELYNRKNDPYELVNAYAPAAPPTGLVSRLQGLEGCARDACRVVEGGP
jgi:N-acetylglucosamine-6-sulfatase